MSIKGFPSQQKLVTGQKSHSEFVTIQPTADFRNAIDSVQRSAFRVDSDTVPRSAGAATGDIDGGGTVIEDTGTPALVGDYVRFEDGNAATLELPIAEVSTNQIRLAVKVPTALLPAQNDTFYIMRYSTSRVDETGATLASVTPAALSFNKDAVLTNVSKDTVTPGNSIPLPVEVLVSGVAVSPATSAQLPSSLGAKTTANSMAVNIASDQIVAVSAASLPLPTGSATEAKQDTIIGHVDGIEASLTSIDGKAFATQTTLAALLTELQLKADLTETQPVSGPLTDAELRAAAVPVSGTFWQATQPVSVASLPLPLGAATSALQTSTETLIGAVTETAPANDTASSGLNGRLQRIAQRITSLIAQIPAALGQTTKSGSLSVTLASDQESLHRSKANAPLRNDYSSVSVTTAAYTQLVASTTSAATRLEVFDSSGQTMVLAVGAAASEVDQFNIFPGGNGIVDLYIPSGSRIAIKAVSATASVGEINVNLYT